MVNVSKIYKIAFWTMLCCFFTLTFGQFIPIYFDSNDSRWTYYLIVLSLILISTTIVVFIRFCKPDKNRKYLTGFSAIIIGVGVTLIFAIIFFLSSLAVWTDASVLYVNTSNRNLKIVTRYLNEGAFGGGTEQGDYEIVLKRKINPFLKIETRIDTNKINKREWIKVIRHPEIVYPDL